MPAVYFIRHGESEANAGQRSLHAATIRITEQGRRQAAQIVAAIDEPPSLVVASSYLRARETAAAALERFPAAAFEEWPVHEFTYLPAAAYANTTLEERRPLAEAYWRRSDPRFVAGEGAESFCGFAERVDSALNRLGAFEGATILVYTHKKFMSAAVWRLVNGPFKISAKRMRKFRAFDKALSIPNGALMRAELGPGRACVGAIVTAHLAVVPA